MILLTKRKYMLLSISLTLLLFQSCISIQKIDYPAEWDTLANSHISLVNMSGSYLNSPYKWTRGKIIADVGQDFSNVIWFLFQSDTHVNQIEYFAINQEDNTISIQLIDKYNDVIKEIKLIESVDYRVENNSILIQKRRGWFLFNMYFGIGYSKDILVLEKDTEEDIVIKKKYTYKGTSFVLIPVYLQEEQWMIYHKK